MMSSPQKSWLFILPWDIYHPGGVNQVVANIFDEMLLHNDFRPILLVSDWNAKTAKSQVINTRETIRFRTYNVFSNKNRVKAFFSFFFHLPLWLKDAGYIVASNNVSVINVHYPTLSALSWLILKRLGLYRGKIFLSLHGLDIRGAISSQGWQKSAWSLLLNNVDNIITCADGLKNEVYDGFNLAEHMVCTIHNGVDIDKIRAKIANEFPFTNLPDKYILNIGTFEYKKGQDILLHSFKDIAEINQNIDLVLVGRTGHTSEQTKNLVSELGLYSRVHIFENLTHNKTLALLNNCLFFVLPSRNEAFAIVLLEAGAFGKAVIATDICGVNELINDGESGYVVASENVEDLRSKIMVFINSQKLTNKFGQRLNSEVLKSFSWERAYNKYLKIAYN